MKEPMLLANTAACIANPAIAFAAIGACAATGVYLMCGAVAVVA